MRSSPAWLAILLAAGLVQAGCDRGARTDSGGALTAAGPSPPSPSVLTGPDARDGDAMRTKRFVAGARSPDEALPADILRGLATDDRVLDCDEGLVDGRSVFAQDWVVAHRIDLDGDGHDDWLVEGRHDCLSGPGDADWWLYAGGGAGRRLVLAAGRASIVELLSSRSHGVADLRLLRSDGSVLHARHDGSSYVLPAVDTEPE